MFVSHEHSGCNYIELYITLQPCIPSQQSQLTGQDESGEDDPQWSDELNPEAEAEVDVVDEEEEETEIQVDHMLNNDDEDDDQPPPIPPSHVYNPPQHMTNMDLHDDETSNSVFYNSHNSIKFHGFNIITFIIPTTQSNFMGLTSAFSSFPQFNQISWV